VIITVFCYWSLSRVTLALTTNNIVDLSVFSECVMHFTRIVDDQETIDHTETIIHAQYQTRNSRHHQLISIHNSSIDESGPIGTLIQPSISVKEDCTLNVLLGVNVKHRSVVNRIIMNSNYTFSSNPFSTYVLVADSQNGHFHYRTWGTVPTRIFYLLFSYSSPSSGGWSPMVLYLCTFCINSPYVIMPLGPDLASVSFLNLRSSLMHLYISFITPSAPRLFRLKFEQKRAFKEMYAQQCRQAFIELIGQTMLSNMTIMMVPKTAYDGRDDPGYTGRVEMGVFFDRVVDFKIATSIWYEEQTKGTVSYCTCNRRDERTLIYEGWIGSFTPEVWLGIWVSFLSLSLVVACKVKKNPTKAACVAFVWKKQVLVSLFDVYSILFRQGNIKKRLLLLLGTGVAAIILAFYENYMTSAIIAPEPPNHHTLISLMEYGYTIALKISATHVNHVQKGLLEKELYKSKVKYKDEQIQTVNRSTYEKLKAKDRNGNYFAYFGFYSDTVRKTLVGRMNLKNEGCNCFILNHGFRENPVYMSAHHALKFSFHETLNRLQGNGLQYFFCSKCHKDYDKLSDLRMKRKMEEAELANNKSSVRSTTEVGSTDYIAFASLSVLFSFVSGLCMIWLFLIIVETKLHIVCFRIAKRVFTRRNWRRVWYKARLKMLTLARVLHL
jgi:hypothetical protein